MSQFEWHVNIKFMCKFGKPASEMILALQQAYDDREKSAVYDWFSQLEDDKHSRRPSTSRTEETIKKSATPDLI
jgi:hypothetical protein